MKSPVALFLIAVLGIALATVFWPESDNPALRHYACVSLDSDSRASAYMLPYPVGAAPKVDQANCSGHGHNNFWNHGYDFVMDIGSPVLATRDGVVRWAKGACHDGDHQCR